jgi:hypothetical protein
MSCIDQDRTRVIDEPTFANRDLRDSRIWQAWARECPCALRRLLQHAGFQYFEFTDTICLVFSPDCREDLTERRCLEMANLIGDFYEVRRRHWLSTRRFWPTDKAPAPSVAISPHLRVEIAPPSAEHH